MVIFRTEQVIFVLIYSFISISSFCLDSSLNRTKVRGKVLVCRHSDNLSETRVEKNLVIKRA